MAYDDPKRYEVVTPQLTLTGARADLYHLVPQKLHDSMGSFILFQDQVMQFSLVSVIFYPLTMLSSSGVE